MLFDYLQVYVFYVLEVCVLYGVEGQVMFLVDVEMVVIIDQYIILQYQCIVVVFGQNVVFQCVMFVCSQWVDVGFEFFFDDDIYGYGNEQEWNCLLYLFVIVGLGLDGDLDYFVQGVGDLVDLCFVYGQWW